MNPESRFEEFCKKGQWKIYKIPELYGIKTPDFFVEASNTPFIVEVKNLEESGEERTDIQPLTINGERVEQSGDYNKEIDSVVNKIEGASTQFKTTKSFSLPHLLIIYSDRLAPLNKEVVFQAMYGKSFSRLSIKKLDNDPKDDVVTNLPPLVVDRTLRRDQNTLVSAMGWQHQQDGMFIIHNLWSDTNFPVSVFNHHKDVNYIPNDIEFKEVIQTETPKISEQKRIP